MRKTLLLTFCISLSLGLRAQFSPDNLVVARTQSTSNSNVSNINLLEFTTDGTAVGAPLPVDHSNFFVSHSASTLSDAMLSLSTDGKYLTMYGYSVLNATGNIQATTAADNPRTLAVIDAHKTQRLIPIAGIHSETAARSSAAFKITDNSYGVYLGGGKTSSTTAIQYLTLNTTDFSVSAPNSIATINTKSLKIYNNQLYNSSSVDPLKLNRIGTGLPTSSGQTLNNLGSPVNNLLNPGDFVLFNDNLLYVADETATTGGIYKFYSPDGGTTWLSAGSVQSGIAGDLLFRGLTGRFEDGKVTLYGVTTKSTGNQIVKIIDETSSSTAISNNTAGVAITSIAMATSTTGFRGISFTPNSTIVLPVDLSSFTARTVKNSVELKWTTSTEKNNKVFEILRSSAGNDYTKIAEVKGKNGNGPNHYTFTDNTVETGYSYYQLKQVDHDGKFKIYGPQAILISFNQDDLKIHTGSSAVEILLNSKYALGDAHISVLSTNGQILSEQSVKISKGSNSITIPISLNRGIYILNVKGKGINEARKFAKQ